MLPRLCALQESETLFLAQAEAAADRWVSFFVGLVVCGSVGLSPFRPGQAASAKLLAWIAQRLHSLPRVTRH